MIARPRRTVTGVTIAVLIIALATMGGYRLAGWSSAGQGHLRLAAVVPNTWVSGTGSDANASSGCGRLGPCLDFFGAYPVTQRGGVLDAADSGPYGPLTITQAITIDGGPGKGLVLAAGSDDGIDIKAGSNDVVILRHLQIHGFGSLSGKAGIRFVSGRALILDDVTIEGFSQHGLSVETPGPALVTITNSYFQSNSLAGIAITPAGGTVQVSISRTTLANNYFGLIAQDGSDVSLTDSVVTGSTNVAIGCQTYGNGSCTIQTAHDRLDHNWAAIWMNHAAGSAQITETISDNDIFSNTYGIYGDFGGTLNVASTSNNRFVNNGVDGVVTSSVTLK